MDEGDSYLQSSTSQRRGLSEESHDLPDVPRKKGGSMLGVILFGFLAILFFFVMVGAVVSVGFLASIENRYQGLQDKANETVSCVLFATYNESTNRVFFSHGPTCAITIWGLAGVIVVSLLLLIASLIRCCVNIGWKLSPASPLIVCDLTLLSIVTVVGFGISAVLFIGRNQSCDSLKQTYSKDVQPQVTNCTSFNSSVTFDNDLYVAAMSSLATGLLLLLITLFHMCFCCLCVFVCCRGKSTKFYVKVDADEPSPFKSQFSMRNERLEDDDEPLADPTADSDDTLPSYESWNTIPTM